MSADAVRSTPGLKVALWAGLLAGTLDILAAVIINTLRGATPMRVLQSVGSGLLGRRAFEGGWVSAGFGLVVHYALMIIIAAIYCGLARRLPWTLRRPVLAGALFGVTAYAVMNAVVVPLSAYPYTMTYPPSTLVIGIGVHIALIGVPIALFVAAAARR